MKTKNKKAKQSTSRVFDITNIILYKSECFSESQRIKNLNFPTYNEHKYKAKESKGELVKSE